MNSIIRMEDISSMIFEINYVIKFYSEIEISL